MQTLLLLALLISGFCCCCNTDPKKPDNLVQLSGGSPLTSYNNDSIKAVHVMVALCDNKYQGIVKVPAGIGNGQNPDNNLYWGAGYGLRSFLKRKDSDWQFVQSLRNLNDTILERVLFRHKTKNVFLLADAYDGRYIKAAMTGYFKASSGDHPASMEYKGKELLFGGAADLVAYIGHNGLMDFNMEQSFPQKDKKKRQAIALACYSKHYFTPFLKNTGAEPLVWTTGLMAPEAYALHDALAAWVNGKPPKEISAAAAKAYSAYQKCSIKAAQKLLVAGW